MDNGERLLKFGKSDFNKSALEAELNNPNLDVISFSYPQKPAAWQDVNDFLGRHPNRLTIGLWFDNDRFFEGKPTWEDLSFLGGMTHLKKLEIFDPPIQSIADVFACTGLESLMVHEHNTTQILSLKGVSALKSLTNLAMHNRCDHFREIGELVQLTSLATWYQKKDIQTLEKLVNLESLYLHSAQSRRDANFLLPMTRLRDLHIWGDFLKSFDLVPKAGKLESLAISRCYRLDNLDFVLEIPTLETLSLYQVSKIKSLPDLSQLPNLKHLSLTQMKRLRGLSGLQNVTTLETLEVSELHIDDLEFWKELVRRNPNIRKVTVESEDWDNWVEWLKEMKANGIETMAIPGQG